METLFGFLSLAIIFLLILICAKKNNHIKSFLFVAFILRSGLVLLDQFDLIKLPDGYSDALKFESIAREFSRDQGLMVVFDFFTFDSLLISRIISFFFTVFVESKMMAQFISVGLGVGSVYLVYKLSLILWDYRSAQKAAWIATLFPSLVLYSSITLREVYVVFFLLIGLIGIVKFLRTNSLNSFFQTISSFFILSLFHGPSSIGGFVFLSYLILRLVKKQIINLYHFKISLISICFIFLFSIPLFLFLAGSISIPYLGGINGLVNFDQNIQRINNYITGNASYPPWLIIESKYEILSKGLTKIFYFLYGPFIWDIKTKYHLIGLFDGLMYVLLTIYLIRNWKSVWENPITRIFLFLFISYIIIYGLSIGNFGTGIRHRSKFVVILIVLAAPKFHKFIFFKKEKLYKK